MRPMSGSGAKTADRVPTTTSMSPRRMRCHWSWRSPSDRPLCWMATRSTNRDRKAAATPSVRAISGTSTRARRPARSVCSASRAYSSVLPLPVTPCTRATWNAPSSSRCRSRSSAASCSAVSVTSGAFAADCPVRPQAPANGSRSTGCRRMLTSSRRPSRRRPATSKPRARSAGAESPAGAAASAASNSRCLAPSLSPAASARPAASRPCAVSSMTRSVLYATASPSSTCEIARRPRRSSAPSTYASGGRVPEAPAAALFRRVRSVDSGRLLAAAAVSSTRRANALNGGPGPPATARLPSSVMATTRRLSSQAIGGTAAATTSPGPQA